MVNIAGSTFGATLTITGSTISGNMATSPTSLGGGIENFTVSTGLGVVNLTNSTVTGNSANNGAGIYNSGTTATINSNFSTIALNAAATNGGGLFQDTSGATNLKNSIVGDNTAGTAGPDIFGTITSQDYNHVENTSGGTFLVEDGKKQGRFIDTSFFALANDVTGSDPQLQPLFTNGGTTLSHLPASGSPVMNTIPNGTNDCGTVITTSQNAATRPQMGACEKGSAERTVTAAGVFIRGRVRTAAGSPIPNAFIEVVGGSIPVAVVARTNQFGYYAIDNLEAGNTYILTVRSKQFSFANPTQVVTAYENISGFDFIGNE